jgi:hypothetical protein
MTDNPVEVLGIKGLASLYLKFKLNIIKFPRFWF